MGTTYDKVTISKDCAGCGKPMHLWQDSTGSGWMHDRAVDEQRCWDDNRAQYEGGTL